MTFTADHVFQAKKWLWDKYPDMYPTDDTNRNRRYFHHETQATSEYFAQLSVGTPPQKFKIFLDTSYNDIWVSSTRSRTYDQTNPSIRFNYSLSSSYKTNARPFNWNEGWVDNGFLQYPGATSTPHGVAPTQGYRSFEDMAMGDICLKEQWFIESVYEAFRYTEFDGAFGKTLNWR
jgi:saccharopepsin